MGEISTNELAKIGHHLKVMYEAGLLEKERRGTWIYYQIVQDRLGALKDVFS